MSLNVHDYDKKLEYELKNLEEADILQVNKKYILEYKDHQTSEDITVARMQRTISLLRQMALWLGKDFKKASEEDLRKLLSFIQNKKCENKDKTYSASTVQTYKATIKAFYKYLEGKNEDYPEKIRWLKVGCKAKDAKLPEDMLSEMEVKQLIEHAPDTQTKALICLLAEGGLRIGEALLMSNHDLEFDDYGCRVTIRYSKTKPRKIRLVKSAPYLLAWLNSKPLKQPDEPLWVLEKNSEAQRLPYATASKRIKTTAKKAGINKRIYAHLFRHSAATLLSEKLSEAQMKEYLGWGQSSRMAAVYIHLSGKQVDNAILEMNGVKKKEEKETKSELMPLKCPRCKTINEATNEYCKQCWLPLTEKNIKAIELSEMIKQKIGKEIEEKIFEILKREEMVEKIKS